MIVVCGSVLIFMGMAIGEGRSSVEADGGVEAMKLLGEKDWSSLSWSYPYSILAYVTLKNSFNIENIRRHRKT